MSASTSQRRFAIDHVLAWYFTLVAGLAIAFHARVQHFPKLLAIYLAAATLAFLMPWATEAWTLSRRLMSRMLLCAILIPTAFLSLAFLLSAVSPDDRSWQLLQWDRRFFGVDPVRSAVSWRLPVLTDFLGFAYACYYVLPLVLGVALYRHRKWKALERTLFAVGLGFLLSYLCYFIYPARSPYLILPDLSPKGGWLCTSLHQFVVVAGLFKTEAFPSGHTALSIVTLALAWRYERRLFWWLLPIGCAILVGTVVLGYHYVVDLVAGVLFAIGFLILLRICGGAEDEIAEKA